MGKRFTATEKWEKAWYRKLPPKLKCFWQYLCDKCDSAGVWDADLDLATIFIGEPIEETDALEAFGERVVVFKPGKWFITGFIPFQYGTLSEACKPHTAILSLLHRHGIEQNEDTLWIPFQKGIEKDKEKEKVQDKEKDKEGESEGETMLVEKDILLRLNNCQPVQYRMTEANLTLIASRLKEVDGDAEGVKQMILRQCQLWIGTPQAEYLRPMTLFGKQKFGSYYDHRNAPVLKFQGNGKPVVEPNHEAGF